jgi:hypothetical protein
LVFVAEFAFVDRSGARSKPLGNELERVYVAAAVVQGTAKGTCSRCRRPRLDPLGAEHLVERGAELPIAIANEEPEGLVISELRDEVARLLGHRASVRT